MNLTFLRDLLCRKEIKIILTTTLIGGGLQLMCSRYIKKHPEFFEEKNAKPEIKNKNPKFRGFFPRGGTLIEASAVTIKIIYFLAENGLLAGLASGGAVALTKLPTSAINIYLRDAFPQNLPQLEKKKFILVDGEKISLDQCDQNLKYLFKVLKDKTLPFKEKEKITGSILTKYLNLKTAKGRLNFVICIVSILLMFSSQNVSNYHIILKNLIKAIKEGKIPKIVGRAIIKLLQKNGVLVNPELLEVVNS